MFKFLFGFFNRRDVTCWYPPHDECGIFQHIEPFPAAAKYLYMIAVVNVLVKRVNRFPNRHVHNDKFIIKWTERCRVAVLRGKPPDKSWCAISKCIDLI